MRRKRTRKDFVIDSLKSVPFKKKENVVLTMKIKGKILTQSPFKMLIDNVGRHFFQLPQMTDRMRYSLAQNRGLRSNPRHASVDSVRNSGNGS